MNEPADTERDAHLRRALRHAPDADLAPPPALRDLILREAQAKAREGAPRAAAAGRKTPLQALWDWIGQPRFAGGLAAVMVIGFAGLLWRERPVETALPSREAVQAPAAVAPAARPAPEAAPSPSPATPTAPAAPITSPTAAAKPAPKASVRREAPATDRAQPPPAAPAPAPAPAPARVVAEPPPQAEARASVAPTDAAPERTLEAKKERQEPRQESLARQRSDYASGSAAKAAAAPAPLSLSIASPAPGGDAAGPPAIATLRQAIAAEPTRWYWQRPGGPSHPFDNAISAWLGRLEAVSRGRWQTVDAGAAVPTLPSPEAELQLLRNGDVSQRLRIGDDAVSWQRGDHGDLLRAPLDAATLAALRQALEAATP